MKFELLKRMIIASLDPSPRENRMQYSAEQKNNLNDSILRNQNRLPDRLSPSEACHHREVCLQQRLLIQQKQIHNSKFN